MSGLPETDVARAQRWWRGRVPEQVRDQVRIEADLAERSVNDRGMPTALAGGC
jgi:hypothetical protein